MADLYELPPGTRVAIRATAHPDLAGRRGVVLRHEEAAEVLAMLARGGVAPPPNAPDPWAPGVWLRLEARGPGRPPSELWAPAWLLVPCGAGGAAWN